MKVGAVVFCSCSAIVAPLLLVGCGTSASSDASTGKPKDPDAPGSDGASSTPDAMAPGGSTEAEGGVGGGAAGSTAEAGRGGAGASHSPDADAGNGGTRTTLDGGSTAGARNGDSPEAGGPPQPAGGASGGGGAAPSPESYAGGPCPEAPPTPGSECEGSGVFCSYGDGAEPGCRQGYACHVSGTWQSASTSWGSCPEVPGVCETMPEGSCERVGERCTFEGLVCACSAERTEQCGGDGCHPLDPPIPQRWECTTPRLQEGCPESAPNAGTRCDDETFSCLYGEGCSGASVTCKDGYHAWEAALCP